MPFRSSFADQPVKTSRLPSFRAEHFPYSGPYPWLDRPDALERIETRLKAGEITAAEAGLCRKWAADGYTIIENLIDHTVLDEVWAAYEKAARSGAIKLPPEPAGEDDPWPGRSLNPHKKIGPSAEF